MLRSIFRGTNLPKRGTRSCLTPWPGFSFEGRGEMVSNGQRARAVVETIVLAVVVMCAALILFSRFALGVEVFQCMSAESHGARADCLQRVVFNHANQWF